MLQVVVLTKDQALSASSRHIYWTDRLERFRVLVERAQARGELPAQVEPQFLLEAVIGPVYVRFLLTGGPLDEQLPAHIVDLVLHGVVRNNSPI